MKRTAVFLTLLVIFSVACQRAASSDSRPQPQLGNFVHNTYTNEYFGLIYSLPEQWRKSATTGNSLPAGSYWLFIGDRNSGGRFLNRIMLMADSVSNYKSPVSEHDYVAAMLRAQVRQGAETLRETSVFELAGNSFYRTDYKRIDGDMVIYNSLVCMKRKDYLLSWSFVAQSQQELEESVNTLQRLSFKRD